MRTAAEYQVADAGPANHTDDIRIALVEDDPMFRHAMEYYLKKIPGNRVFAFSSGEECFRHYHQLDPEILILDYKLDDRDRPEVMNGLEILEEVKAVDPNKEVLFVSSQKNFDVATNAIKKGAAAYIVKDEKTMNRLTEEVTSMLTAVRLRRAELKNGKRLLALMIVSGFIFSIAYFSGYSWFTLPMKILFGATAIVAALLILSGREQRHSLFHHHEEAKPGDWLD